MLNLARVLSSAITAAARQGLVGALSIRRPAGTVIDPVTNVATGAELLQTVRAVPLRATELRRMGGAIITAKVAVLVLGDELAWVPSFGDFGTFGGETMTVTVVEPLNPSGLQPLAYTIGLGGDGV